MVNLINQLYPKVDNLTQFIHPKYHKKFGYLSSEKIVWIAKKLAEKIKKSWINKLLIVECGVSPLANLIIKVLEKNNYKLDHKFIKFPREQLWNSFEVFNYYLNDTERKEFLMKKVLDQILVCLSKLWKSVSLKNPTRENALKLLSESLSCPLFESKKWLKTVIRNLNKKDDNCLKIIINKIFEWTEIYNFLDGEIIYLDEYVDSWTTLRNTYNYCSLINNQIRLNIFSYFCFLDNPVEYNVESIYNQSVAQKCFENWVYPYENRVDLIWYYYLISEKSFVKISLKDLWKVNKNDSWTIVFLNDLLEYIENHKILDKIKSLVKNKSLRDYLNSQHIMYYLLYLLEKNIWDDEVIREFYYQIFDMYGPIRTPLPDRFHLKYVQIFEENEEMFLIKNMLKVFEIKYKKIKPILVAQIANVFNQRREQFDAWVKKFLVTSC